MGLLDYLPIPLKEAAQNPVNQILGFVLVFLILKHSTDQPITPKHSHPKVIVIREFTPKELSEFNGVDGKPIYLAVKGEVFDVSSQPGFYGPGSSYENFAGRDASRGLANNSFDESLLTDLDSSIDTLQDLNKEESESLEEWHSHFLKKYTVIGKLVNEKQKK
ncbi:cytochrome b5-like heme/steroid binding domain-containing protein [Globomyces pollinis-pini]|nr:cytochrome b5-like heme/steroid binding domain-containing protein [Globomyces pollinis-pini]